MSLLNWNTVEEEEMFPNFDIGDSTSSTASSKGSPSIRQPSSSSERFPDLSSNRARAPSDTSSITSDVSNTHSTHGWSSQNKRHSLVHLSPNDARDRSKTQQQSSRRHSAPISQAVAALQSGRKRSPSFDLYGDDSELQDAESKIGFCEICLKHCDVH